MNKDTGTTDRTNSFKSNIKAWSLEPHKDDRMETKISSVDFTSEQFTAFDSNKSYIVLHLFKKENHPSAVRNGNSPLASHSNASPSLFKLAISTFEQLTPRGIEHKFSTHDLQTIFFQSSLLKPLFSSAGKNDSLQQNGHSQQISYDLYLWHGKNSPASTQAFAVTKGFEIERKLLEPRLIQCIFDAGSPVAISQYFNDDVPPICSKSDLLKSSSSSSAAALFMSLYQHCHLFRNLTNNNNSVNNNNGWDEEPDLAFRSLLQLPPDNNISTNSMEVHKEDVEDADVEMQASPINSPASSIKSSSSSSSVSTPTNTSKQPFDRSTTYSHPLPASFRLQMGKFPVSSIPTVNLPSPRKRPAPEGTKNSDSKRHSKNIQLTDISTPSSLSTPRSSLSSNTISSERDRLRVNLGSVEHGERNDPSPTPRRMQKEIVPDRCLSGNELVVYYRKICSQVYDYVYLGSDLVARNKDLLLTNGITHIINAAKVVCDVYFPDDFVYHVLNLYDAGNESILGSFFGVIDFIEEARQKNGKVYIHCYEGVSRSTTLTIAYLMWKLRKKFTVVMEEVKQKRPVASPNPGFIVQLLQWEKMILEPQPQMYRISPQNDKFVEHKHLVPKVCYSQVLDSRTCFVLHSTSTNVIYVWIGSKSKNLIQEAQVVAQQLKKYMSDQATRIEMVQEGQETEEFEAARSALKFDSKLVANIDSDNPYPDLDYLDMELPIVPVQTPTVQETIPEVVPALEHADLYVYPKMKAIANFDSDDLDEDKAYVLYPRTSKDLLYVWLGEGFLEAQDMPAQEIGQKIADVFMQSRNERNSNTRIIIVEQDNEPDEFWHYFVNG